jgi:putative ABC transport system permease protein
MLFLDVRQSFRGLAARPWPTVLIVLTLALGIGANAAVFSVIDALPLRPLPYKDPDRLVRIGSVLGGDQGTMMFAELRDVAGLRDVFEDVAAYTDQGLYNASGDGPPEERALDQPGTLLDPSDCPRPTPCIQ